MPSPDKPPAPPEPEPAAAPESDVAPRTAWHPMLVALLERYLPEGYQLIAEFLLARQSQRVDIVVIRKVDVAQGPVQKLHSILDYLRAHTLIEHKGPTDDLAAEDLLTLLGYAFQYMRIAKVSDPAELCLMVVCDRIPPGFVRQVEKHSGELTEQAGGLWHGKIAGFVLHGVETRQVLQRRDRTERLLYAFSRAHLSNPTALFPMDAEEQPCTFGYVSKWNNSAGKEATWH